jgi:hypothetical protein
LEDTRKSNTYHGVTEKDEKNLPQINLIDADRLQFQEAKLGGSWLLI